jgi:hypothetical protein
MNRGPVYKYFKSIDRYANGVSLTYNGKKSFPTFCGGVFTIFTILMVIYWWVATWLNHRLHPPGPQNNNYLQQVTVAPQVPLV